MNRVRLYSIILIACIAGYVWIIINSHPHSPVGMLQQDVCMFKNVTGIPCPSCGSTRSVLALIKGDFISSFNLNPIGYIILPCLVSIPFWIISDLLRKSDSFHRFFLLGEAKVKNKKIAVVLILLIVINWIWNIQKGI